MRSNVTKEETLLKVGVLGCGSIGQAAHLESCAKARNIELTAICDVADDLRGKMAAVYDPRREYKDYNRMLEDPEIQAVVIGISDEFHVSCAKAAIRAGKHVFVEKPLGVSVEECLELKDLVDRSGLTLQVGFMKRFDGGLQYAKTFLREAMGEMTTYKGWYCDNLGRKAVTANVMPILYSSSSMKMPPVDARAVRERYNLMAHGSHLFDTARFLAGEITSLEAKYVEKGGLHSWLIGCEFASGAIGTLDLAVSIAADWHEGADIYGTGGTVFARLHNPWEFRTSTVECFHRETGMIDKPYVADGQFYRRQLEAFADTVLHGIPSDAATVEDGIASVKAMIATYRSVHRQGCRIDLKDVEGSM
ncbi:MAG: Gfo/Idh/MocA family oxidoreductase [Clostridiales bacterium]|nr:Gfo/Idh/MocA family oxidoreductase [Clostridiales bacterium]